MSNKQGMYKISLEESSFCYCFTSYAVYTYVEIVFIRRLEYSETPKTGLLKISDSWPPSGSRMITGLTDKHPDAASLDYFIE